MMIKSEKIDAKEFGEIKENKDRLIEELSKKLYLKNHLLDLETNLQKIKNEIKEYNDNIFQLICQTPETTFENIETENYNTVCVICKNTCQEDFTFEIQNEREDKLSRYKAFPTSSNCLKCEHSKKYHIHIQTKIKIILKDSSLEDQRLKKIQDLSERCILKDGIQREIKSEIASLKKEIELKIQTINDLISKIKSKCARFNYLNEINAKINVLSEEKENKNLRILEFQKNLFEELEILTFHLNVWGRERRSTGRFVA